MVHDAFLNFRNPNLRNNFKEETSNDQLASNCSWNASRLQIEKLFVIETSSSRGMASANDLAGFDL